MLYVTLDGSRRGGTPMSKTRFGFIASFVSIVALTALASAPRAYGAPACDPDAVAAATASVQTACPCAGKTAPNGDVTAWKNHGQYVSCVTRARNAAAKQLQLSKSCVRDATRC